MAFKIIPLTAAHERADFRCGESALDFFIQERALKDVTRGLSSCFVALENDANVVIGYYTLSNYLVEKKSIPLSATQRKKLRYNKLPATLLGRIAVRSELRGSGLGDDLMMHALANAFECSRRCASYAVIIEPKNDKLRTHYAEYGFLELIDLPLMYYPMNSVAELRLPCIEF